jgi:hypothetical protein
MIKFFSRRNFLGQKRYYFRIQDEDNNKIVAPSQGYNSAQSRWKGLCALKDEMLRHAAGPVPIHDEDLEPHSPILKYWPPAS